MPLTPRLLAGGLVHTLLEAQVDRTPIKLALVDRDEQLTYEELDARTNALAHLLRIKGVGPEVLVGVACERSVAMVVAVLAIMKAGGAYVPIDPDYPRERVEFICTDSGMALVLTQNTVVGLFKGLGVDCLCLDDPSLSKGLPSVRLGTPMSPDAAAFVLYTSGSTGRPKGVVGTHSAICNRLDWAQQVYPYSLEEVACARTTLGFVDSVAEIFAPLTLGIPLVVIGRAAQKDFAGMISELREKQVSRIVLVPSLLTTLLEVFPDLGLLVPKLHYWFVGGEPVPIPLVEAFKKALPGRKLINIYGATEVCGDATWFDFDEMPPGLANAPIGHPLLGVWARIVDEHFRELPAMEVGEVCVSGICLARGYLGRPDLTAERFIPNPFPEGGRLYRTNDLGRRLPDGAIEYLGRLDQQVKIRGMRVEVGEVESRLAEFPNLAQVLALAQEDDRGRRTLVAFYVALDGRSVSPAALRAFLSERLPEYMVPSSFIQLESFPTNANGKVDRRGLSEWRPPTLLGACPEPPMGDVEQRLAAIWEVVLGHGPIGRDQNFHDLGGHSLAAIRIAAAVQEEFGQTIPVAELLRYPSVAALAGYLTELGSSGAHLSSPRVAIPASGRPAPARFPLSLHQFPFWFVNALTGKVNVVGEVFGFQGETDLDRLQKAFSESVASFEALWVAISRWQPSQSPTALRPCHFEVVDRREDPRPSQEILREEAAILHSIPFDLGRPPHIHGSLIRLRGTDQRLILAVPHIVADMASLELFRQRMEAVYHGEQARAQVGPEIKLHDLVAWELRRDSSDQIGEDQAYWAALASGPALNRVPGNFFLDRMAKKKSRAFSEQILAPELENQLREYAKGRKATLPFTVVAGVSAGLARAWGTDRLALLLMLEKRDRPELQGLFANQAVMMRVAVEECQGALGDLVDRIGRQLLQSYGHTDHIIERPTFFNNFWTMAPPPLCRIVERISAGMARLWPEGGIAPGLLAQYMFALLQYPGLARKGYQGPQVRDILVALNIMPEVYRSPNSGREGFRVIRKRSLDLTLRPDDTLINADPLLDLTLQIHFSRNEAGLITLNLYGGGIDQAGLEGIRDSVLAALMEIGRTEE